MKLMLSSLSGLGNINPSSNYNLIITENDSLSECDVKSICNYFTSPSGTITINNNNTGCNSQEEVQLHCLTSVDDKIATKEFNLFPNPTSNYITITMQRDLPIYEAIIYNHKGQKVLLAKPIINTIDVSTLKPGIYFIAVTTKDWRGRTKFIKQ